MFFNSFTKYDHGKLMKPFMNENYSTLHQGNEAWFCHATGKGSGVTAEYLLWQSTVKVRSSTQSLVT
jgi:hypothetical protein